MDLLCPNCGEELCPSLAYRDGFREYLCYTCGAEELLRAPNTPLLECGRCERQMLNRDDYLCPGCRADTL